MFRKGDKVEIDRSMYGINPGEIKQDYKFKATVYQDSTIENTNGVKHYLLFEGKQTPPLPNRLSYGDLNDTTFIYKSVELIPGRQISLRRMYMSKIGFKGNNDKLYVEFMFPTYSDWIDNYINYTEKLRPTHLVEGRTKLKTRKQSSISKVFYRDPKTKTRHSVSKTNKIKEIERKIKDHQIFCEDRISKYYEELDAEIEMQYHKNNGRFDKTIRRLKGNNTPTRASRTSRTSRTSRKSLSA